MTITYTGLIISRKYAVSCSKRVVPLMTYLQSLATTAISGISQRAGSMSVISKYVPSSIQSWIMT